MRKPPACELCSRETWDGAVILGGPRPSYVCNACVIALSDEAAARGEIPPLAAWELEPVDEEPPF
jgi:hypothetical protein